MKFSQATILAYASAAAAAPAFTWPTLGSGSTGSLFNFPTWPPKASTTPSAAASALPSASSIKLPSVPSAAPISAAPAASASSAPSAAPSAVAPPQQDCKWQGDAGGSTEDGIKNTYCCTDVTIVYARGTSETGNVGYSTGPSFFKALRSKLGASKVTVQGTEYEATWDSIASGGGKGPAQMAADVKTILGRCPNTKIVLSGYSQGGMVVHNALSKGGLGGSQAQAAVLFGDPYNGQSAGSLPASKVKQFCASGDSVCDGSGGFGITAAHGTYPDNAEEAASFVVTALGLSTPH